MICSSRWERAKVRQVTSTGIHTGTEKPTHSQQHSTERNSQSQSSQSNRARAGKGVSENQSALPLIETGAHQNAAQERELTERPREPIELSSPDRDYRTVTTSDSNVASPTRSSSESSTEDSQAPNPPSLLSLRPSHPPPLPLPHIHPSIPHTSQLQRRRRRATFTSPDDTLLTRRPYHQRYYHHL